MKGKIYEGEDVFMKGRCIYKEENVFTKGKIYL